MAVLCQGESGLQASKVNFNELTLKALNCAKSSRNYALRLAECTIFCWPEFSSIFICSMVIDEAFFSKIVSTWYTHVKMQIPRGCVLFIWYEEHGVTFARLRCLEIQIPCNEASQSKKLP